MASAGQPELARRTSTRERGIAGRKCTASDCRTQQWRASAPSGALVAPAAEKSLKIGGRPAFSDHQGRNRGKQRARHNGRRSCQGRAERLHDPAGRFKPGWRGRLTKTVAGGSMQAGRGGFFRRILSRPTAVRARVVGRGKLWRLFHTARQGHTRQSAAPARWKQQRHRSH